MSTTVVPAVIDIDFSFREVFQLRQENGHICLNNFTKHFKEERRVSDYARLSRTKSYLFQLSRNLGVKEDDLLIIKRGSPENGGGTFAHPLVAIDFAKWFNTSLGIWIDSHIDLDKLDKENLVIFVEPVKPKSVYLIYCQDTSLTKIGVSDDVERRLNTLQNQCGVPLISLFESIKSLDSYKIEQHLHEKFKEKRKFGEWFSLNNLDMCEATLYIYSKL